MHSTDQLSAFYTQLSGLLKARLPLHGAVLQIAREVPSRKFKSVFAEVGQACENGSSLAEAVAAHPDVFSDFHRRLIGAGESAGHLPAVLHSLGRLATFHQALNHRMLEIFAYPLFGLVFTAGLLLWLSISIFPVIDEMLRGILGETYSNHLLGIPRHIGNWKEFYLTLLGLFIGFSIYLTLPFPACKRMLHKVAMALPGVSRIASSIEHARFCELIAVWLRSGHPFPEACDLISEMIYAPPLRASLKEVGVQTRLGKSPAEALASVPGVDPLIALTIEKCPENLLSGELEELSSLYEARSEAGLASVSKAWKIFMFSLFYITAGLLCYAATSVLSDVIKSIGL